MIKFLLILFFAYLLYQLFKNTSISFKSKSDSNIIDADFEEIE